MMFIKKEVFGKSIILITCGFLLVFSSCKSTKKIQAAIQKKDTISVHITNQSDTDSLLVIKNILEEIKSKKIDFKTFSAKIKAEYEDNKGKQTNITVYVRCIKDSVIWISGYATVFNIEAFRILIKQDSVFVLDKINKEIQRRSIDYLQEVTQIPFNFITLQNLLVGNPVFFNDNVVYYKETESKILLATIGEYFKDLITLDKTNRNLLHSKLDDIDLNRNRTADITYADYENNNGIIFSTFREIVVSEKNKLDIQLKFKQYEFNKELEIFFNIPTNYKSR